MKLAWLSTEPVFPPVESALSQPNGLLAVGGDLSVERLLTAYRAGIFPWYTPGEPILWWSPAPRMVLFPEQLKVARSLAKSLRNLHYQIRIDTAFEDVIKACSVSGDRQNNTWIVPEMIAAYSELYRLGYAHSFETWMDGQLVGGLYGVALGLMFYGESMFSLRRDASKLAFVHMTRHLSQMGVTMIDCQMPSAYLESLGAQLISRPAFLGTLKAQIIKPQPATMWQGILTEDSV